MQIGQQTPGAGYARPFVPPPANLSRETDGQSRGERIVGRLDRDKDGKIGPSEVAESRFGSKMSVERFARLDANSDGALDAAELDARRGWAWGKAMREEMMQNVVTAQMADYLTEKVPEAMPGDDLVKAVIARLDGDGSGALNSEEIAGTRLAEKIGAGFYDLDGDKSGTLDMAELGAFIRAEVLGLADPVAAPAEEAVEEVAAADPEETTEVAEAAEVPEAAETAETAAPETVAAPEAGTLDPQQAMISAFETALQMIKDGQEPRSTYDVVSALYGTAKDIFAV